MTTDQARRLFDDLCATYDQLAPLHPAPVEGGEGIGHRRAVRKAIETLAHRRGAK